MMDRQSFLNPFRTDVVTSPEQPVPADVPEIHSEPFRLCQGAYNAVLRDRYSSSVLLHGEAGCGKTHLLGRLRRWLSGEMASQPQLSPAAFVAIRMETAPSQIWRHVRRRFAEELTRRAQDGTCPLDGILLRFAAGHSGNVEEAFANAEIKDLGNDLIRLLEHFSAGRHRRLCRAWMAGDGLSDSDLQLLNLPSAALEEVEQDFAESNARRVVLAIVRLSSPLPVVFCFDQLEALGISQQGTSSFRPFSRLGAALVDETSNVLVISTILTTYLRDLQNGSIDSDYDRIGKQAMDLHPLDLKLGRALIDSRLGLVPELNGEDPVPDSRLRSFYEGQHGTCNARKLIHEARRLFSEWQECEPLPSIPVEAVLKQEFEHHWASSEVRKTPAHTDATLAHGLPVALEMLGQTTTATDAGVIIGSGPAATEVIFANHTNMVGLAATLRRVIDKGKAGESLCLVRDQRLPISSTARATQDRLKQIAQAGGRLIRVETEALAALDAMRRLLTVATAGDLSTNGETIEAKSVREWLARNLPQEVQTLAEQLLNREALPVDDAGSDLLVELLAKRKVVSVEDAARATSWPRERIENYARTHALHMRWFGGSRPVVCQAVAAGSEKETDDDQ